MPGYSDRINHALAFAAKHHDQAVRRGTRPPYFTQPANVAVILTAYGCEEDCVVAGVLVNVVQDYASSGASRELLLGRVAEKFGPAVLETAHAIVERRYDGEGTEMSMEERRRDLLSRLAHVSDASRWACAAEAVHDAGTILADLQRTQFPEAVWGRFSAGRNGTISSFEQLHGRLREVGFDAPIMEELGAMAEALAHHRQH
jgi:hypothetical protein